MKKYKVKVEVKLVHLNGPQGEVSRRPAEVVTVPGTIEFRLPSNVVGNIIVWYDATLDRPDTNHSPLDE